MSFKCDFSFRLDPKAKHEIDQKLSVKWKNVVLECVGEAKKQCGEVFHDTGNNMRSINPAGAVDRHGNVHINPEKIGGDIFTTSGYGGYGECGTRKMSARPYIVPAVGHVMKHVAPRILKDTL